MYVRLIISSSDSCGYLTEVTFGCDCRQINFFLGMFDVYFLRFM